MEKAQVILSELSKNQTDYASAKSHAKQIDDLLGLQCESIEKDIKIKEKKNPEQNFWQGLDIQSLQTPYSEILEMIQAINPKDGDKWVDLGAGYGRMGLSLGFLKPNVKFLGFEYVSERVIEGQRILKLWNIKNAELKTADIAADEFILPAAEVYFIYDFGSQKDVYKVLEKLRLQAAKKDIQLIARGRGMRNWIFMDFPWLSIKRPQHFTNWSLFTT